MEGKRSKRGRVGEGRPTKRTPEVVAKIAEAIAIGLTDREAGLLAGVRHDTMTEWRKDPEFSGAIKRAGAQRLLLRLKRIEGGEQGWQGTAWALERLHPSRFARPEAQFAQQINVNTGRSRGSGIILDPEAPQALSDAYDRERAGGLASISCATRETVFERMGQHHGLDAEAAYFFSKAKSGRLACL